MEALAYILILTCLILFLVVGYLFKRLRNTEAEKAELKARFQEYESKINNLQLENLESKLNPHLFKNILNSIQSHAYQTYYSMDKLANVLDYILYESKRGFVSAKEEIDFALSLIEINKIKISPLFELNVKTKVNDEALYPQKLLAPMVSIDLIENAFKHADLQSPDSFITIVFELKDGNFSLTVSNKISERKPILKENGGIGNESLEQRLKLIYKNGYKLERFTEGEVFVAHLKINLLEHIDKMHHLR
ncbi:sensor histidine kinase [Pseudopedobacter beijingensis]|uniref:Sensor histidine kinase n=1 Tax=Pseudopedobacter beijingensis TaxID=1207056 RepID=A0ABW4IGC1_9SPHI